MRGDQNGMEKSFNSRAKKKRTDPNIVLEEEAVECGDHLDVLGKVERGLKMTSR